MSADQNPTLSSPSLRDGSGKGGATTVKVDQDPTLSSPLLRNGSDKGGATTAAMDTSSVESTGIRKLIKQATDVLLPTSMITWRYKTRRNEMSLTFDDAPLPAYTPEVLAILRHYGVTSTFFVIGERAEQHPRLAEQIASDGHEIANHSYSHPRFEQLTLSEARGEIEHARRVIADIGVPYSPLFRPPHGKFTRQAVLGAWQQRHSVVFWNRDLKDYRASNAREICELMPRAFAAGDVVLYHGTNAAAVDALAAVIEKMRSGGAQLVSIAQLSGRKRGDAAQAAGCAA